MGPEEGVLMATTSWLATHPKEIDSPLFVGNAMSKPG